MNQEQTNEDLAHSHPGDLPSIKIKGLLPNTEYMARIAIYSDYSHRSLGKTSGVIVLKTKSKLFIIVWRALYNII